MHWRVFIEVAAGLTLPAKAVATGNVAATVEPRAIRSWLMAAPLLVSAPERGLESGWSKELKEQRYLVWSKLLTRPVAATLGPNPTEIFRTPVSFRGAPSDPQPSLQ